MIGAISGKVLLKKPDALLLMTESVGYTVLMPPTLLEKIQLGETVFVYTYTHVREDLMQLFGFFSIEQLQLFELLLGVSGIGPKTALLIVDRGTQSVLEAIMQADVAFFTAIPRLGSKNAQKVIIELKSKVGSIKDLDLTTIDGEKNAEVISALTSLGFSRKEALEVLKKVPPEIVLLEEKIKYAFKLLGSKTV